MVKQSTAENTVQSNGQVPFCFLDLVAAVTSLQFNTGLGSQVPIYYHVRALGLRDVHIGLGENRRAQRTRL